MKNYFSLMGKGLLNLRLNKKRGMMLKKRLIGVLVLLTTLALPGFSQKAKKDPVLLDFGTTKVTKAEFERVYQKNNGGYEAARSHTPAQYQEYLDLYINFKRKVFEAEALGLDKTPAFEQEFGGYRKQLAQPYLSAKEVEDHLIEEAYERSKTLIHASHLLVSLSPSPSPEDTATAYARIVAYRDSVLKGISDFNDLSQRVSDDPSARENKGDLGYFSVFDMVYPFESAAYQTKPGEVSQPIRTRFGYHLIKVHEVLPSGGRKTAAHIIIRPGERYSGGDSAQTEKIIREIYEKLKGGADFAQLASQYSDDPTTAAKGGDLGANRLLPEMEVIKIRLGKGEFSEPFETRFGWHILKVTEVEEVESLETAKASLKQRIARDTRSQLGREAMIERIKKENGYAFNQANFDEFKQTLDVNFSRGNWKPDSAQGALYAKTLFSLSGASLNVPIKEFTDHYVTTRAREPRLDPAAAAEALVKSFIETRLLEFEEAQLPAKNPDFRYLVQEYRDGILLFTLMEQKVWKKAVEDTTGLRAFYEANKADFQANELMDVREYRSTDREIVAQARDMLAAGKPEQEVDSVLNSDSPLRLRITTQTYERGKGDLNDALFAQPAGTVSEVLDQSNYFRVLVVKEKFPAGVKPFEKARSEAITKYQDHLEKEWLAELGKKYPVKTNKKTLASLFK